MLKESADESVTPVIPDEFIFTENYKVSSMESWFPRLKETGVPVPETTFVELEPDTIEEGTIHEMFFADWDVEDVKEAIQEIGGPPVFVRTDQMSDKHNFADAAKINSTEEEEINRTVSALISQNTRTDPPRPFSSLVIREFLELDSHFRAFNDLPISSEIRLFIDGGRVQSAYFYWDWESIVQGMRRICENNPLKNQQELHRVSQSFLSMIETIQDELPQILELANKVTDEFKDYWSLDFARTKEGDWVAIDMAPGQLSHEPSYEFEIGR